MEEDLERALGEKGRELQAALEELRVKEFSYKVNELRCSLPSLNRCVICTLHLPCKHYNSLAEMPKPPSPIKENLSFQSCTRNLNISEIMPKLPQTEQKDFKIRFRGRESKTRTSSQQRAVSLPNAQKLKLIEQIETYREEKIRKEIEKIQELKESETRQKKDHLALEAARLKHVEKQKEKLRVYKEEVRVRHDMVREQMDNEEKRRRNEEEKRKKYLDMRKRELEAYYEKKKMMENLTKQKVRDLENEMVKGVRAK